MITRAFCWALVLISGAAEASSKLPVPEVERLSNGLTVVWFLNDRLPLVDVVVLTQSGSRDDPRGKSGTAELLSAALDRGAAGLSAQELALQTEKLGAAKYISADDDTMTVGVHGLAVDGERLVGLLADIVLKPNLAPLEIQREHARLVDQWRHIGDSSETLANIAFARQIASGTDYARGSSLSLAEFNKVTPLDVTGFYKKHFTPANSVLMVVGRAPQAEFKKIITERFSRWQGEAPKREYVPVKVPKLETAPGQVLLLDKPGATQTQVRMGFRIPLIHSPNRYPLAVANALLGEYFLSRLNSVIRDQLGLTYGIGSTIAYDPGIARIVISSATQSANTGKLIVKTREILNELKSTPVPEAELKMAKEYLTGGFPIGMSTLGAVASRWLAGYVFHLGPEYLNEYLPRVGEVTVNQVMKAVKEDFNTRGLLTVVAGDAKQIEKTLRAEGIPFKRVTERDLF